MIHADELAHYIALAGLAMHEDEHESVMKDVERVFSYMEILSKVDITGVPPMETHLQDGIRLREDVPSPSDTKGSLFFRIMLHG